MANVRPCLSVAAAALDVVVLPVELRVSSIYWIILAIVDFAYQLYRPSRRRPQSFTATTHSIATSTSGAEARRRSTAPP